MGDVVFRRKPAEYDVMQHGDARTPPSIALELARRGGYDAKWFIDAVHLSGRRGRVRWLSGIIGIRFWRPRS